MNTFPNDPKKSTKLQMLEDRRDTLLKMSTIKIVLQGIPCSGKTSLFTGLYLQRHDVETGMRISFDEQSMVYLRQMADHFLETGQMEATAAIAPKVISFDVILPDGRKFRIESRDFAGHLFEPRRQELPGPGFGDEARKSISECDAILCLADSRQPAYPIEDAIDLLPQRTPVLFLPTKIDEFLESPQSLLNQSRAAAKAIYESIDLTSIRQMDQFFRSRWPERQYKCVPVAALGPVFHRGKLYVDLPINPTDLRPYNLYRPWLEIIDAWVRRRDERLLELNDLIARERGRIQEEHQTAMQLENDRVARQAQLLLEEQEHKLQAKYDAEAKVTQEMASLESRREEIESNIENAGMNPVSLFIGWNSHREITKEIRNKKGLAESTDDVIAEPDLMSTFVIPCVLLASFVAGLCWMISLFS